MYVRVAKDPGFMMRLNGVTGKPHATPIGLEANKLVRHPSCIDFPREWRVDRLCGTMVEAHTFTPRRHSAICSSTICCVRGWLDALERIWNILQVSVDTPGAQRFL